MSDTSRAILLITDISGFTGFMRQKSISMNHGKQVVLHLLKAVMRAAKRPLRVAEIEGDAGFFYAVSKQKDLNLMAGINSSGGRLRCRRVTMSPRLLELTYRRSKPVLLFEPI